MPFAVARLKRHIAGVLCVVLVAAAALRPTPARAYSLLTHEELIDLTWQSAIVPLLLSRYPTLTPTQLEHARAYAYGGCVIQDIGYYPLGDASFSNLTHYVRSGDFVVSLFRNAENADELAFAVGALSHYIGDSFGHSEATNLAVPIEFPELRARYGNVVNYAEGEHQHVQTEFAFDVDGIAHHRFAPVHYLRHVGLEVPNRQLAAAFYQTYGLSENFGGGRRLRINEGAFRFAVHHLVPRVAYATTLLHRNHEPADPDTPEMQQLNREIAAVAQRNHWDQYRKRPGPGTYSLAGLLWILPKFGPLTLVSVKGPTPATEASYIHSVVQSEDLLARALRRFTPPPSSPSPAQLTAATATPTPAQAQAQAQAQAEPPSSAAPPKGATGQRHPLKNRDLDTGNPVRPAGYRLTDDTYADLLHRLAAAPRQPIPPGVKDDILAYYNNLSLPFATKKRPPAWAVVLADLATLGGMPTSTEPQNFPVYGAEAAANGDRGSGPAQPAGKEATAP